MTAPCTGPGTSAPTRSAGPRAGAGVHRRPSDDLGSRRARRPASAGRPGCRSTASRVGAGDPRDRSDRPGRPRGGRAGARASRSPSAGGRQSSAATVTPLATSGAANPARPDVDRAEAVGEEDGRNGVDHARAPSVAPTASVSCATRLTIPAAMRAAPALLDARMTPASARVSSWAKSPADRASVPHTEATTLMPPAAICRRAPRILDRGRECTGGVRVGAVAKDDVEEDDRGRRVRRHGHDVLVAQARIDHRMRPTDRVLVIAEVEDLVRGRALGTKRRLDDELGLARERASTEQAADPRLPGNEAADRRLDRASQARIDLRRVPAAVARRARARWRSPPRPRRWPPGSPQRREPRPDRRPGS